MCTQAAVAHVESADYNWVFQYIQQVKCHYLNYLFAYYSANANIVRSMPTFFFNKNNYITFGVQYLEKQFFAF